MKKIIIVFSLICLGFIFSPDMPKDESWRQKDRDYISANRILYKGMGQPFEPVEKKPLLLIPVHAVISGKFLQ